MKRIATHRKPDADAIVATWLAERYLFDAEPAQIVFVARSVDFSPGIADCLVDVSNRYELEHFIFDHKPPAFADRNQSCAARLLWEYLVSIGRDVGHLQSLIAVVHEGDCNPPRRASDQLAQSRSDGLHAHVAMMRKQAGSDEGLYRAVGAWLNRYDEAVKSGCDWPQKENYVA